MSFLAIEIGNANIKIGHFEKDDLAETLKMPLGGHVAEFWPQLEQSMGEERFGSIRAVGLSSVVKGLYEAILEALGGVCSMVGRKRPRTWRITRESEFPLGSVYRPGLLGTDRMLGAVAGVHLFGKPVVTVDIGTAVTIDHVDGQGVFQGGFILAGGGLRAQALAEHTSLLPEIPVPQSPPPFIGTDTVGCLSSGIYHGMRAEIQTLVAEVHREIGTITPVVVTGQGNRLFQRGLPEGWHIDPWLVLKGIYYTCQETDDRGQGTA
jgi:type III pantothenate kinase